MRRLEYPCVLTPDDAGGFVVSFPDVPEALTCGADKAEALAAAEDALSVALTFYLEEGNAPPAPSRRRAGQFRIGPSLQIALKAAVAQALRESGKRPADLARALGLDYKSVARILDPNHATKTATLEAALAALGKRVAVATEDRAA